MRECALCDIRRALLGRWFVIAVLASLAALYISIGQESDYMISLFRDREFAHLRYTLSDLLEKAMAGKFGAMTFPALAALPFAAQPLQEIRSGAFRPAVFRVGRKAWVLGKCIACLLTGMLCPLLAALLLTALLQGMMLAYGGGWFPAGELMRIASPLLSRMLLGGMWAGIGCITALVSETSAAASLAPLCLCYVLTWIATRFFPQIALINPSHWLTGEIWPPAIFLALVTIALLFTLNREVLRHA